MRFIQKLNQLKNHSADFFIENITQKSLPDISFFFSCLFFSDHFNHFVCFLGVLNIVLVNLYLLYQKPNFVCFCCSFYKFSFDFPTLWATKLILLTSFFILSSISSLISRVFSFASSFNFFYQYILFHCDWIFWIFQDWPTNNSV